MTFEELQANKVANEGENAQGQLSAEEYNTLLERVQDLSQPGHGEPQLNPGQTGGNVNISIIDGVVDMGIGNGYVQVPQGRLVAYINNPSIDIDSDDWTSFDFIPRPIPIVIYLSDGEITLSSTSGYINVIFKGSANRAVPARTNLYVPARISNFIYAKGTVIITLYPLPNRKVAFTVSQAYN